MFNCGRRGVWGVLLLTAGAWSAGAAYAGAVEMCAHCWSTTGHCRAGCPLSVRPRAVPSNTRHYGGYYVGGGNAYGRGEPRMPNEGTWGWDYGGIWFPKLVMLDWTHGRRYQGGAGSYPTAGPTRRPSQ